VGENEEKRNKEKKFEKLLAKLRRRLEERGRGSPGGRKG